MVLPSSYLIDGEFSLSSMQLISYKMNITVKYDTFQRKTISNLEEIYYHCCHLCNNLKFRNKLPQHLRADNALTKEYVSSHSLRKIQPLFFQNRAFYAKFIVLIIWHQNVDTMQFVGVHNASSSNFYSLIRRR